MFVFVLFLSQFCVILFFTAHAHTYITRVACAHFSHRLRANRERVREREREKKNCCTHYTRVSSSPFRHIHIHTYTITFLSFSLPSHLFFCLTRTLFRGFCVCVDVFFSLSILERAHTHTSKSSFVFLCPLFSLLIACWRRLAFFFFSCVCVRGPVRTFFYFFFFFFFFFFYNANIMSAARPIDSRQLHALRS